MVFLLLVSAHMTDKSSNSHELSQLLQKLQKVQQSPTPKDTATLKLPSMESLMGGLSLQRAKSGSCEILSCEHENKQFDF